MTTATTDPATKSKSIIAFDISSKVLGNALVDLQGAVSTRGYLPILSAVHVEANEATLKLRTSNIDTTIVVSVPALIEQPGEAAILYSQLRAFAGVLAGDVMLGITATKDKAQVKAAKSHATIECFDSADFPAMPVVGPDIITLPASGLLNALRLVLPSVADDDTRPTLACLCVDLRPDGVQFAGADGSRLHVCHLGGVAVEQALQLLVPKASITALGKLLDPKGDGVTIQQAGEHKLAFRQNDHLLVTNTAEGRFPNYQPLIPTQTARTLTAKAGVWAQATRVATVFADKSNYTLRLRAPAGTGAVDATLSMEGTEEVFAIEAIGDGETDVKVNAKFFGEVFASLPDAATVTLGCNSPSSPIKFTSGDFCGVIMPMHSKEGGA